jgi:DNA repair ATPase RecN
MKKHILSIPFSLLLVIPLYTHAESASSTQATSTKETASTTEMTDSYSSDQEFTLCQQQAIETRDTRISTSRSLYNTAMTGALTDRKNKEKSAIALSDKDTKKNAIKTSAETYKNLVKKAQNDLTDARKVAWQSFEDDIQACRDTQAVSTEEASQVVAEPAITETKTNPSFAKKRELKEVSSDEGTSFKNVFRALKSLFD